MSDVLLVLACYVKIAQNFWPAVVATGLVAWLIDQSRK